MKIWLGGNHRMRNSEAFGRNTLIDFIRGLVILDMILVHYSIYFPTIASNVINYHDIAMEGFVFLSGFMIGRHYLPRFEAGKWPVTKRLLMRGANLFLIHYIMIITISYPHYLAVVGSYQTVDTARFLYESFAFFNQVGLMHILPTFIPLLMLSPIILWLLAKKHEYLLIASSILCFGIGQWNPYLFNYGNQTMFPVILWQIYYIGGCWFGKYLSEEGRYCSVKVGRWFSVSCACLLVALCFKHSSWLPISITQFKLAHGLRIEKFPLNVEGLFYGSILLNFVFAMVVRFQVVLVNMKAVTNLFVIIGRHSLLVFVVHVYFAKTIEIIQAITGTNLALAYLMIFLNVLFSYALIIRYEGKYIMADKTRWNGGRVLLK